MFQPAPSLWVDANQEKRLQSLVKSGKTPQKVAVRARIVLLAAEGVANHAIAARLDISRPTVLLWRSRFTRAGVPGLLKDARRPGRNKAVPPEAIQRVVEATLHTTPPAATHWTIRTMARAQGLSRMTVQRIWKQHGLQPHRVETFKLSRDPHFVEKLRDVVGLYLDPPDKALVLSVDEKSQIQALARIDRETPSELALHLVVDNYSTHKSPPVKRWLKRHPRFHLHFIPTGSSWLNMVERWFRDITQRRIRRGTFQSVKDLITAIHGYLEHYNQVPTRFVWTKDADMILAKIHRCKQALGTAH